MDKPCITRWKVDERMSGNWQDLWEAGKWSRMIVSRDLMGSATESTTDPVDEPQAKGIDTVNRPTEEELLNELEGVAPVPSEAAAPEAPLPNTRQTGRWMTGLAVHDGELYLSDAGSGVVRVYNLESFPPPGTDMAEPAQPVRTFPLDRPGHLAFDSSGRLWAIQACAKGERTQREDLPKGTNWRKISAWAPIITPGRVVCCDPRTGRTLAVIDDVTEPMDLAYSAKDRMLLVAERNGEHQIRFYADLNTQRPTLARTFGAKGGIYASGDRLGQKGEVKPGKLHPPTGVGVDAEGNLYVTGGGGPSDYWPVVIASYAPDGTRRWLRSGHTFMDSAWYDPHDGHMYTAVSRMKMDWSKTEPGSEWSYQALTVDRFAYPQDPRNTGTAHILRVVHVGDERLLFEGWRGINVFRFRPGSGEIGVWCASLDVGGFDPNATLWTDRNGNARQDQGEWERCDALWGGKDVDESGGLWVPSGDRRGVRHYPLNGIDDNGIPQYSFASSHVYPIPEDNPFRDSHTRWTSGFDQIDYDAASDTLVAAGFTYAFPHQLEHGFGGFGRILTCYRNFTRQPEKAWQVLLAYHQLHNDKPRSMDAAGDYVFMARIKNQRVEVYRKSDGAYIGPLDPFKTPGLNNGTLIDHGHGLRASVRKNGEYVLGVYDSLCNKAFLYRWMPSEDRPAPPPEPPVLVAQGGDRAISVRWSRVAAARTYRLYRGRHPGHETLYKDNLKGPFYLDENAADGKAYSYCVTAVNAEGESVRTNSFIAQAYGVPHPVPGRIEAENYAPGGSGEGFHHPPGEDRIDKNRRYGLYRADGAHITSEGLGRLVHGNYSVFALRPGTWWRYKLDVARPGPYTILVRGQADQKQGDLRLEVNGQGIGSIRIPQTKEFHDTYHFGHPSVWGEAALREVELAAGEQTLTVVAEGVGIHLDRIEIYPHEPSDDLDISLDGGEVDARVGYRPWPYFHVPQPIPGRIEAEYFDRGGEGVAFHRESGGRTVEAPAFRYPVQFHTDWNLNRLAYMLLRPLDRTMPLGLVQSDGTDVAEVAWGGNFHIAWGASDFPCWTAYTVRVAEAGRYTVFLGGVKRNGSYPKYRLLLDDEPLTPPFQPGGQPGDTVVRLPAGGHVFKGVNTSYFGGTLDFIRIDRAGISAADGVTDPNQAAGQTESVVKIERKGESAKF